MIILLYHQITNISPDRDPLRLSVSPDLFDRQLRYLSSHGYVCMPLSTAIKTRLRGDQLPAGAFSITFDDGYQDNYNQALPILLKYGFTATVFLVPDQVGKTTKWWGVNEDQGFPLMSWETIRRMAEEGIDFGSHSQTHALLDELDDEQVANELRTSKEVIEGKIGKPVELFAFPYEKSSPRLQGEVERQGYLAACGSLLFPEDRFNLWRIQLFGTTSMLAFRVMISGLWRRFVEIKYHTRFGVALRRIRKRHISGYGFQGGG